MAEFLKGLGLGEKDVTKVMAISTQGCPKWCKQHSACFFSDSMGPGKGCCTSMQAVEAFPQVLGLPVEAQLAGNVDKLRKTWKMTDKVIPGVIKRQPQVRIWLACA